MAAPTSVCRYCRFHLLKRAYSDEAVPRRAYSVEAATDPLARHASQRVETENPGIARDHSVQVSVNS